MIVIVMSIVNSLLMGLTLVLASPIYQPELVQPQMIVIQILPIAYSPLLVADLAFLTSKKEDLVVVTHYLDTIENVLLLSLVFIIR